MANYSIIGNHMIIDKKEYDRISAGTDAETLLKFKNIIVGAWKLSSSEYEEYRFESDGTWTRYSVFYDEGNNSLLSENYLEGGTYRVLTDGVLEVYYGQDTVQFQQFSYNEVLRTLSGNGISLEKK